MAPGVPRPRLCCASEAPAVQPGIRPVGPVFRLLEVDCPAAAGVGVFAGPEPWRACVRAPHLLSGVYSLGHRWSSLSESAEREVPSPMWEGGGNNNNRFVLDLYVRT